jgi:flavin reductase (DIM6/NTAB) family NADH-FMN oxidoreductase RutF
MVDPDAASAFSALTGALDPPMFIVTVHVRGERDGCLVGFATQASIDPPRFLACLSERNRTYRLARDADRMAVHVVPDEALDLAELFGGSTGDEVDKLARCEWAEGPGGLPILAHCPSWFVGVVLDRRPLGDHVGFLLEPEAVSSTPPASALGLARAKRIDPGHEA